jgi:hypothetical protein
LAGEPPTFDWLIFGIASCVHRLRLMLQTFALHFHCPPGCSWSLMDRFFSILSFPIGLLICFGPALYVWLKLELNATDHEKKRDTDRKH